MAGSFTRNDRTVTPEERPIAATRERHVFISFASADIDLANRVLEGIERAGLRCWIAHRDIAPAASYPAEIAGAVKSSGAMLLLLSAPANVSRHVLREVEMAFNAGVPILPVRIDGQLPSSDLLYFLSTTQWLDAGADVGEDDAARIHTALRALLEGRTPAAGAREEGGWNRWKLATAAAILLVATAAAIWALSNRPSDTPADASPEPVTASGRGGPAAPPDGIRTTVNPRDGATYVWVPAGRFLMGCSAGDPDCEDDEQPVHQVTVAQGFWLGRTEVTEAQYARHADAAVPAAASAEDDLPAAGVTWADAKAYCAAVGGRLPTEAEWEYAARGGTTTRYHDPPAGVAWYEANSGGQARPVGTKAPNAFGLHDMLGNVNEWVRDRYFNAYDDTGGGEVVEPLAPNHFVVARGGSWLSDPAGLRVSRRLEHFLDTAEPFIGFRCAHDAL